MEDKMLFNKEHGARRRKRRRSEASVDDGSIAYDKDQAVNSDTIPSRCPTEITAADSTNNADHGSRILVLHRVECLRSKNPAEDHSEHARTAYFLDQPRLFRTDTRAHALRGLETILDVDEYLECHDQYTAVVYRTHSCQGYHKNVRNKFQKQVPPNMDIQLFLRMKPWFFSLPADMQPSAHFKETITISSPQLRQDLNVIADDNKHCLGPWDTPHNLTASYDYFLHNLTTFDECSKTLALADQEGMTSFLNYFDCNYGIEHKAAVELFVSGTVTHKTFPKLFNVGELIVIESEGGHQAYRTEVIDEVDLHKIVLSCSYWEFDGMFLKRQELIEVQWPGGSSLPMTSLSAYPLKFDQTDLAHKLRERGSMFWTCCHKKVVSYTPLGASSFELHAANPRYMIDMETYRYLHPEKYGSTTYTEDVLQTILTDDEAPSKDSEFLILLPPTILGYGFHDKKWRTLQVQYIREVSWNAKAFDRLVLKSHKKELIHAVVTSHLEKNKAADIVDNKGNGLILLLHGPPGTGKTLTAESVAEVAQKPLYRITCGDIGTEPQAVETYLESALHIGTVWGCVMLLDEADVFLEERSQMDLVRNALVAVFLRVLEYYDGILILTSNRVALFDEAFKSRVQMAIFYPKLDERGRKEIWRNFFRALKVAEVDMDDEGLQDKVAALAECDLNGRQIRNTIKTARQLAKFHNQVLQFQHLERVIDVAKEFEEHLNMSRGYTDSQWVEQQRLR